VLCRGQRWDEQRVTERVHRGPGPSNHAGRAPGAVGVVSVTTPAASPATTAVHSLLGSRTTRLLSCCAPLVALATAARCVSSVRTLRTRRAARNVAVPRLSPRGFPGEDGDSASSVLGFLPLLAVFLLLQR